jgi:hypothetical protein
VLGQHGLAAVPNQFAALEFPKGSVMKAYIVTTTIYVPEALYGYAANLKQFGHDKEVGFIVVADRKTPTAAAKVVHDLSKQGFTAEYWDTDRQKSWLTKFSGLDEIIPYNSCCRTNVGYLLAVEKGAELIISIDDDNYVTECDYFSLHSIVGSVQEMQTVSSSSGWFNVCSLLRTEPERDIYLRGFPYAKRWCNEHLEWNVSRGRVVVNMGLWLDEPDVDAVTRLAAPVRSTGVSAERTMIAPGTYSPINVQNTAYHRDTLPCIYYVPQGQKIDGLVMERYGDVWQSCLAGLVVNHLNDRISVGHPLTRHIRHPHNLFSDLRQELVGMEVTDRFVEALTDVRLSGNTYCDTYLGLSEALQSKASFIAGPNEHLRKYFLQLSDFMKIWVSTCNSIM